MSFPSRRWRTTPRFHKSTRALRRRGAAVRVHAGEPRALRRDRRPLPARAAALGGAAGALSRAAPAGLHHGERDAARRAGCSAARRPRSRTSCSYYTMFYTQAGRQVRAAASAARCRARCTAPSGSPRSCARSWASSRARPIASGTFTLLEVECLGACDRAPVVMVNDAWHECLTPESCRAADRRPAQTRGEAALTGCHHVVEKSRSNE